MVPSILNVVSARALGNPQCLESWVPASACYPAHALRHESCAKCWKVGMKLAHLQPPSKLTHVWVWLTTELQTLQVWSSSVNVELSASGGFDGFRPYSSMVLYTRKKHPILTLFLYAIEASPWMA